MSLDGFKLEITANEQYLNDILSSSRVDDSERNTVLNLLEAIKYVKYGMVANPALIRDLISPQEAKMGVLGPVAIDDDVLIDESQTEAVKKILAMDNLMVIQGPPGAGKTTVIVEAIKQIKRKHHNAKVMVSSQTHVAVDNVIEKLLKIDEFKGKLARVRQNDKSAEDVAELDVDGIIDNYLADCDEDIRDYIRSYDNEESKYGNDFVRRHVADITLSKDIIGVTVNSLKGCHFDSKYSLDYVIVDEVGKLNFAELMFVARFAKKLILIGDPMQLPPELHMFDREKDKYDVASYNRINHNPYINYVFDNVSEDCKTFLNKQYRMVVEIGSYISDVFYNGKNKLKNGRKDSNPEALNYIDYDIRGHEVTGGKNGSSPANKREVMIVKTLITSILANEDVNDIAVIAPYAGQISSLRNSLDFMPKDNINTIDAFQGKDAKIVVYSCVRNDGEPTLFFKKPNRINVAISRAKNQIWLIGSEKYISKVDYLNKYINYGKSKDMDVQTGKCNRYFYDGKDIVKK